VKVSLHELSAAQRDTPHAADRRRRASERGAHRPAGAARAGGAAGAGIVRARESTISH